MSPIGGRGTEQVRQNQDLAGLAVVQPEVVQGLLHLLGALAAQDIEHEDIRQPLAKAMTGHGMQGRAQWGMTDKKELGLVQ